MNLPKVHDNLLVQELSDEVLVYHLTTNNSYCLNSTARIVFNACDGKTTLEELQVKAGLSDDIIYFTLDELNRNGLFDSDYISPFSGMSRREVIRKVGLASMIALPVVTGLLSPLSTNAASSTCPVGQVPGDPVATQGRGNSCGCGTNVRSGNTCGAGTTFAPSSTCRTGCLCRAISCSSITDTCTGICE